MAPSLRADEPRLDARRDRKTRKPLVERRRRARINESLRELRLLLADGERLRREASERFAAGYIQCMHEVHTFVSACPAIEGATAAALLNHLLEAMPLHEGALRELLAEMWHRMFRVKPVPPPHEPAVTRA
ncbi:transcription cofactor HES-6-like [Nothoprocta perdicaria]|uniref:transcription cofactor HES-6-like n=1 Tax=Nothoprocta perdicaria TaxID=30464 RepID=UPI000E1C2D40|nr:transcription cofactor HES-6-like [Nothoprocta perdicaria]